MKAIYRHPRMPKSPTRMILEHMQKDRIERREKKGKLLYTDKERRHGVALVLWLESPDSCLVLDLRPEAIMTPALVDDGQPVSICCFFFLNPCRLSISLAF